MSVKFAIDFDGTCVYHRFPEMGEDVPDAVRVMQRMVAAGHKLILYTMRSNHDKYPTSLTDAVEWFNARGIELYAIQKDRGQVSWTSSNKCYAQVYIDDAALGCPLIFDEEVSDRAFVNWEAVEAFLEAGGYLPELEDNQG